MKITPEQLAEEKYVLIDKLDHNQLIPFVQLHLKKKTKYTLLYYFCNGLAFGITGFLFAYGVKADGYSFGNRFTHFCWGIVGAFLLLPLHEYIHVLAYRSQGAVHTSYASNIKKFYFMALADRFVANKKEFTVVALAPFLFISISLLIPTFLLSADWAILFAGTFLAHTAMCSGDFGLLSYFEFHKDKKIVTYDDVENKISYFYRKEK